MNKFKVGDRVRVKCGSYSGYPSGSPYNLPREVGVVSTWVSDTSIVVRYGSDFSPPVNGDCFDLTQDGPVRTVTRKEIVPGVYGIVEVIKSTGVIKAEVLVRTTPWGIGRTPAELRAAAATFNELADALDEVA